MLKKTLLFSKMMQGYDASGLTVENMPQEVALAGLTAYLYDVFDWNRNDTTPVFGLISQQDIREMQYGGRGKGYLVVGTASIEIEWVRGQRIKDKTCELELK